MPLSTSTETLISKFRWKGIFIPAEAMALVLEGDLTLTEAVLAGVIDAMVDVRGEGCWATNAELGKCVGVKLLSTISTMVGKLKRLGLVSQVGNKLVHGRTFRVLDTKWSRIVNACTVRDIPKGRLGISLINSSSLRSEESNGTVGSKQPTQDEGNMGFIKTLDTRPINERVSQEDLGFADTLRAAVTTKSSRVQKWRRSSWADQFRILRSELQGDTAKIKKVMDWYTRNIGKMYVPVAYSAETFRTKFDQIEAAMMRNSLPPTVEVGSMTPDVKDAYERIRMTLPWEKGTENLAGPVQQTFLNHQAYRRRWVHLRDLIKSGKAERWIADRREFVNRILNELSTSGAFTEKHFERISQLVRLPTYKDWNGRFEKFVWTEDSQMFQNTLRDWCGGAAGYALAQKLLKAVSDEG